MMHYKFLLWLGHFLIIKLDKFTQLPCHLWCGDLCNCYPYRIDNKNKVKETKEALKRLNDE